MERTNGFDEPRFVLRGAWAGAAAGFLGYLVAGAVPGMLYGGYMGLAMAGAIFGTPVEPSVLVKLMTGGGLLLGAVSALFFFLVVGATLGTFGSIALVQVGRLALRIEKAAVARIRATAAQPAEVPALSAEHAPGPIVSALKASLEPQAEVEATRERKTG